MNGKNFYLTGMKTGYCLSENDQGSFNSTRWRPLAKRSFPDANPDLRCVQRWMRYKLSHYERARTASSFESTSRRVELVKQYAIIGRTCVCFVTSLTSHPRNKLEELVAGLFSKLG